MFNTGGPSFPFDSYPTLESFNAPDTLSTCSTQQMFQALQPANQVHQAANQVPEMIMGVSGSYGQPLQPAYSTNSYLPQQQSYQAELQLRNLQQQHLQQQQLLFPRNSFKPLQQQQPQQSSPFSSLTYNSLLSMRSELALLQQQRQARRASSMDTNATIQPEAAPHPLQHQFSQPQLHHSQNQLGVPPQPQHAHASNVHSQLLPPAHLPTHFLNQTPALDEQLLPRTSSSNTAHMPWIEEGNMALRPSASDQLSRTSTSRMMKLSQKKAPSARMDPPAPQSSSMQGPSPSASKGKAALLANNSFGSRAGDRAQSEGGWESAALAAIAAVDAEKHGGDFGTHEESSPHPAEQHPKQCSQQQSSNSNSSSSSNSERHKVRSRAASQCLDDGHHVPSRAASQHLDDKRQVPSRATSQRQDDYGQVLSRAASQHQDDKRQVPSRVASQPLDDERPFLSMSLEELRKANMKRSMSRRHTVADNSDLPSGLGAFGSGCILHLSNGTNSRGLVRSTCGSSSSLQPFPEAEESAAEKPPMLKITASRRGAYPEFLAGPPRAPSARLPRHSHTGGMASKPFGTELSNGLAAVERIKARPSVTDSESQGNADGGDNEQGCADPTSARRAQLLHSNSITVSGPASILAGSLTSRGSVGQLLMPSGLETGPTGFRASANGASSGHSGTANPGAANRRLQKFASFSGEPRTTSFSPPSIISLKEFSQLGYGGVPAAPPRFYNAAVDQIKEEDELEDGMTSSRSSSRCSSLGVPLVPLQGERGPPTAADPLAKEAQACSEASSYHLREGASTTSSDSFERRYGMRPNEYREALKAALVQKEQEASEQEQNTAGLAQSLGPELEGPEQQKMQTGEETREWGSGDSSSGSREHNSTEENVVQQLAAKEAAVQAKKAATRAMAAAADAAVASVSVAAGDAPVIQADAAEYLHSSMEGTHVHLQSANAVLEQPAPVEHLAPIPELRPQSPKLQAPSPPPTLSSLAHLSEPSATRLAGPLHGELAPPSTPSALSYATPLAPSAPAVTPASLNSPAVIPQITATSLIDPALALCQQDLTPNSMAVPHPQLQPPEGSGSSRNTPYPSFPATSSASMVGGRTVHAAPPSAAAPSWSPINLNVGSSVSNDGLIVGSSLGNNGLIVESSLDASDLIVGSSLGNKGLIVESSLGASDLSAAAAAVHVNTAGAAAFSSPSRVPLQAMSSPSYSGSRPSSSVESAPGSEARRMLRARLRMRLSSHPVTVIAADLMP